MYMPCMAYVRHAAAEVLLHVHLCCHCTGTGSAMVTALLLPTMLHTNARRSMLLQC